MLYTLYELNHYALKPWRALADAAQAALTHPLSPAYYTTAGKTAAAALDVFESITRRYGKPRFNLPTTLVNGQPVPVKGEVVWEDSFCQLKHFKRDPEMMKKLHPDHKEEDPKVLIVAPMSGHYATLLRGTVEAMLPEHDVYITDWVDARTVPIFQGRFDLNDFIDYLIRMLQHLGPNVHIVAVCQPGPGCLAATSIMAEDNDPCQPATLTIMGSPIDARKSPTAPNLLAEERDFKWFKDNMIMTVPFPHPGATRRVYPGFIQLTSFMTMNRDRHIDAHRQYYEDLVKGDGDSAAKHREFYDEYLSVMDLTEEFYLQTIHDVFKEHLLPRGKFYHRGRLVDPAAIETTALMTVEGEKDDISGIGQTQAAHDLCINIPQDRQFDYIQPGVGHYGVFNGSRFRNEIQPRVRDFIRSFKIRPESVSLPQAKSQAKALVKAQTKTRSKTDAEPKAKARPKAKAKANSKSTPKPNKVNNVSRLN